jgi:hypothetical protein
VGNIAAFSPKPFVSPEKAINKSDFRPKSAIPQAKRKISKKYRI